MKKLCSLLLALLMVITILPFSQIIAFADIVDITFNDNGIISTASLEAGSALADPTSDIEGNQFLGWYTDTTFETKVETVPDSAATLYAKWETTVIDFNNITSTDTGNFSYNQRVVENGVLSTVFQSAETAYFAIPAYDVAGIADAYKFVAGYDYDVTLVYAKEGAAVNSNAKRYLKLVYGTGKGEGTAVVFGDEIPYAAVDPVEYVTHKVSFTAEFTGVVSITANNIFDSGKFAVDKIIITEKVPFTGIKLNSNGNELESDLVEGDDLPTLIDTDAGTFLGWYTDTTFTTKVETAPAGPATLYAKWSKLVINFSSIVGNDTINFSGYERPVKDGLLNATFQNSGTTSYFMIPAYDAKGVTEAFKVENGKAYKVTIKYAKMTNNAADSVKRYLRVIYGTVADIQGTEDGVAAVFEDEIPYVAEDPLNFVTQSVSFIATKESTISITANNIFGNGGFAVDYIIVEETVIEDEEIGGGETIIITGTTGDCTWTLNGTVLTISGNGAVENCEMWEDYDITEVIIEDGVTSIGVMAFSNCTKLTSIKIPDSVTSVGAGVFNNTGYYNNDANWENNLLYIGKHLIKSKEVVSDDYTIKNGTLTIAGNSFENCVSLTSVTIPNSVISIGDYAFKGCTNLKNVTIPNSVISIGNGAFYNCKDLINVTIPNSVTSIGSSAFYYCESLESIIVPNSVTSIDSKTFEACTSLTSITIPNSVISIGGNAFTYCISLTSVTIPDSVTSIGKYAFRSCTNLRSVTIPDSVTSIGFGAFNGCNALKKIVLPFVGTELYGTENNHLGYIFGGPENSDNQEFLPTSLKTVVITGGNLIDSFAFYKCSNIEEVIITENVREISYSVFEYCTKLKAIYIPNCVTKMDYTTTFEKCAQLTIYCSKNSEAHDYAQTLDIPFKIVCAYKDKSGTIYGDYTNSNAVTHTYDNVLDTECNICGSIRAKHVGKTLVKINGVWHYVVNGEFSNATTLVKYNGVYYYVKNGVKCNDNTLVKYNGKWYHVNGGKYVKDTTLVKYNGVYYYVKNGVKCNDNTLVKYGNKWYHVKDGQWVKDTTLVKYTDGNYYYVKDGVKNTTANTLCKYGSAYYHVKGGKWVKDTTLVKYNSKWYYVKNGKYDMTFSGKVKYNGKYYTVKNGVKV